MTYIRNKLHKISNQWDVCAPIRCVSVPFLHYQGIVLPSTWCCLLQECISAKIVSDVHQPDIHPCSCKSYATNTDTTKAVCHKAENMLNTTPCFGFSAVLSFLFVCERMMFCTFLANFTYTTIRQATRNRRTCITAISIENRIRFFQKFQTHLAIMHGSSCYAKIRDKLALGIAFDMIFIPEVCLVVLLRPACIGILLCKHRRLFWG